jgi:hypothetical protein
MIGSNLVSMREVLEVVEEYEQIQPRGVSPQLISWELIESEVVVGTAVRLASARGMIEHSGWDPRRGEWLWRLTRSGREQLAAAAA